MTITEKKKSKTALIVVDIQNDFIPNGKLPVTDGDAILPIVNKLLHANFDLKIATKDWHPADHGSFASVHGKQVGEKVNLYGIEQILWPDHCIQNTYGAEFAPGLEADRFEKIFFKGTNSAVDSYSTFFDNGKRKSTGLDDYLKQNEITGIYFAGLATDYCVKYSVLDALNLGYRVNVIVDACRGVELNKGDTSNALKEMQAQGASLIYFAGLRGFFLADES